MLNALNKAIEIYLGLESFGYNSLFYFPAALSFILSRQIICKLQRLKIQQ
jgi:hypothetical protein